MANYDMTYCVRNCKNMKCVRNYDYAPQGFAVSLAYFDDCRSFIERKDKDVSEEPETNA